ncbi:hypothetical protein Misp01_77920 [Microtetraspora sp. NBRC 13810]|uniref:peptidase inhibitor family I36 protein n=1 Tax=Microtetraspora sp. NBRC 13810 TaxID=3030990 RepID=UPI0024A0D59B|nr:peptidase inhibitor family I36 protein [Microtetraspora sp. NBRC 13810]GLW12664.1 hypothetical protein Misp01_77920 [Microtetraspora sp. NBRC 13810]
MKRIRWAAVAAAAATAGTGLALPTPAAATAAPVAAPANFICPLIIAVCAFTEPGGTGSRKIIIRDEANLAPPVRSAINNTGEPWCFYSSPGFQGSNREVSAGGVVPNFGFAARSARSGSCNQE